MKSYKVHGNIVLYLLIDPVLMPGSRVSCTQCELCVNLSVLLLSFTILSWGNVNLVQFNCAYSCAYHNCVTNITCACLCCTYFFKSKTYSVFLFCCLTCCKLFELSCKDLFWTQVTPQYLLQSQLMALKHINGTVYIVMRLPPWTVYTLTCRSCKSALPFYAHSLFFICCWKFWSVVETWIT